MNDKVAYDTVKLNDAIDNLNKYYHDYVAAINSLDIEMKSLESKWGSTDKSIYDEFKEKYVEKKTKLIEVSNVIKSLIDNLSNKRNEFEEATLDTKNNFI